MDELLKRNCDVKGEAVKIGNANSLTGSNQSSHSPSVAGDSLDVKVEITPAPPTPICDLQNSYSIESTSSLTICSDASSKSQATSPLVATHARKFSEISHESGSFLNPIGNFNRINPSPPNTASARLFKKLEEMIDLSSPYNHYRCLSPSETNLSIERSAILSPNPRMLDAGKPGSSRLLRRQFSLDKDDLSMQKHSNLETISSLVDSTKHSSGATLKAPYQPLMTSSSLPGNSGSNLVSSKLHKHQSASVAQDLEKIEEIPISPLNTPLNPNNSAKDAYSFKNSNSNNNLKTPPPNCEDTKEINMSIV